VVVVVVLVVVVVGGVDPKELPGTTPLLLASKLVNVEREPAFSSNREV
jgi:hypothetical protein